jgi:hypothetical protein
VAEPKAETENLAAHETLAGPPSPSPIKQGPTMEILQAFEVSLTSNKVCLVLGLGWKILTQEIPC